MTRRQSVADLEHAVHALNGQAGALTRISTPGYDGHTATAPATAGRLAKLCAEVDPEGVLPEAERLQRARARRQAQLLTGKARKAAARLAAARRT